MVKKVNDRMKELNLLDERNFKICQRLTSSTHKLDEYLKDHPLLLNIFKNYRAKKYDELTLFICFLVTLPHWAMESKFFDRDTISYSTVKFLAILRGESEDFTPASLISQLWLSSKLISSNEDVPLNKMSFFDPNSEKAEDIQKLVISGYNGLPSLEYMYIIRVIMNFCVYGFDDDAYKFIQPILEGVPCERRSSELIQRIAFTIQNLFDIEKILIGLENEFDFYNLKQTTYQSFVEKVDKTFYKNDDAGGVNDGVINYPDDVDLKELTNVRISSEPEPPEKYMKITKEAAQIAVRLFDDLLLPQALQLYNSESDAYEQQKKANTLERVILDIEFNIFTMTALTFTGPFRNAKRDNINVDKLLENLVSKKILKYGMFLQTLVRPVTSWSRYLPDIHDEQQYVEFTETMKNNYGLSMEKYIKMYEQNEAHAKGKGIKLTLAGADDLKIQGERIILINEKIGQKTHAEAAKADASIPVQVNSVSDASKDQIIVAARTSDQTRINNDHGAVTENFELDYRRQDGYMQDFPGGDMLMENEIDLSTTQNKQKLCSIFDYDFILTDENDQSMPARYLGPNGYLNAQKRIYISPITSAVVHCT
ncbi:unnamed protein product [Didymodactylos carnosus]|uniref:Uncharacterized protein n=1 Tax=Didymodactylos carnosus TaxID=1234261 RepID=A0A8S2ESL1_9BILA|nr:unnamed protein product [Didymodactylos carnosus]CAF4095823.1 unnamed protein product [Didymodactylos carnosus]